MEIKLPKNPAGNSKTCKTCMHWLVAESFRAVIMSNENGIQAMPIKEMIATGQSIPANLPQETVGPCTATPTWLTQADKHWCGQHRPRIELATVGD